MNLNLIRTSRVSAFWFAAAFLVVSSPTVLAAPPMSPAGIGERVANSTFIYLADIETREFLEDRRAYLPAGARFIIFDEKKRYRGVDWRLILTETGLWGYIESTQRPTAYFNPNLLELFIQNDKIAIITRSDKIEILLSADAKFVINLTRSETYIFLGESPDGIKVDVSKKLNLGKDVKVEATIPYDKNMVAVYDKSDRLTRDAIREFERSKADGIFGIKKPCGLEHITQLGGGGGAEFSFDAWFVKANIGGNAKLTRSEVLNPEFGIRRSYYRRRDGAGSFHVSEKQECKNKQYSSYRAVNPESREIEISANFAKENGFEVDRNTGRLLITVPEDYFKLFDMLKDRKFSNNEIPFLISEIAETDPRL